MSDDPRITITKLERHSEHGYWQAHVSMNGSTLSVDRRYGSWQADVRTSRGSRQFTRADVLPHVAEALQRKVRRLEKRAS